MTYFIIRIISNAINVYSLVMLIYAVLSWFPGGYETALGKLVISVVEPFLRLFRGLPLQFGRRDFTVMVAFFVLKFLNVLVLWLVGYLSLLW